MTASRIREHLRHRMVAAALLLLVPLAGCLGATDEGSGNVTPPLAKEDWITSFDWSPEAVPSAFAFRVQFTLSEEGQCVLRKESVIQGSARGEGPHGGNIAWHLLTLLDGGPNQTSSTLNMYYDYANVGVGGSSTTSAWHRLDETTGGYGTFGFLVRQTIDLNGTWVMHFFGRGLLAEYFDGNRATYLGIDCGKPFRIDSIKVAHDPFLMRSGDSEDGTYAQAAFVTADLDSSWAVTTDAPSEFAAMWWARSGQFAWNGPAGGTQVNLEDPPAGLRDDGVGLYMGSGPAGEYSFRVWDSLPNADAVVAGSTVPNADFLGAIAAWHDASSLDKILAG